MKAVKTQKAEVAVADKFEIVTGYEEMDEDTKAEFEDEMDDLDADGGIEAKRIKIPSGGGKAFEVETDDPDDPEVLKEIDGVILFTHHMNAYWAHAFGAADADGNTDKAPDCSSLDGKTGLDRTTGEVRECASCPYNQFGSAGYGKACKNMRRLYIIRSGQPGVYLLTVPPTSMRDMNKSLKALMGKTKTPYTRQVVTLRLAVAESRDKIKYSRVTLEGKEMLPPELFPVTQQLRAGIKGSYEQALADAPGIAAEPVVQAAQAADAPQPAAEKPDPDGFMNIPEGAGEELPFE